MPYIRQNRRENIKTNCIYGINFFRIETLGDLAYAINSLCVEYLLGSRYNCRGVDLNFSTLNDVPKVLDAVKHEYIRRIIVPYEEKKLKENGDVYGELLEKLGLNEDGNV